MIKNKVEYFYYYITDLNRILIEYDLKFKSKFFFFELNYLNLQVIKNEKNIKSNFCLLALTCLSVEYVLYNFNNNYFNYQITNLNLVQPKYNLKFFCNVVFNSYYYLMFCLMLFKQLTKKSFKKNKKIQINQLLVLNTLLSYYTSDNLIFFNFSLKLTNLVVKYCVNSFINLKLKKLILFL